MTDNRQTKEAATVRERSEFIKRIEDFAKFMEKEYIDDSDERSLLISATDRSIGESQGGMMHIAVGDKTLTTAGLASMMQQDGFDEMFRMARVVSTDDDDISDVIRDKRHRLHVDYGIAVILGVWTLCIVAIGVAGIMHWVLTITNLALMAFTWLNVWREIRPLRRQIGRLEASCQKDRIERTRRKMEALLFDSLRHLTRQDNDDDKA